MLFTSFSVRCSVVRSYPRNPNKESIKSPSLQTSSDFPSPKASRKLRWTEQKAGVAFNDASLRASPLDRLAVNAASYFAGLRMISKLLANLGAKKKLRDPSLR